MRDSVDSSSGPPRECSAANRLMSLRSTRQCVALVDLPVLRIVRRGDRHVVHDFDVDVHLDFEPHDSMEAPDTEAIARAVHALAAHHAGSEPETFARTIAHHCSTRFAVVVRATIEVRVRGWQRLTVGGRQRERDLVGPAGEVRVARVVADAERERVSAGFREMQLLTAAAAELDPLFLLSLDALWSYGWAEIPFDTQWQQVRRALTEAYAERAHAPGATLATALARAVLDESPAVRAVELRLEIARRHAVDMTAFGMENAGEVFGEMGSARGVHTVFVEREEITG